MKKRTAMAAAAILAMTAATSFASEVTWTKGEVKKVDMAQSKVTVKHEEIKNLDMPGMTMVFFVPEKSVIESLKVGDKKQFEFADMNGRVVVKQVK